MPYHRSEEHTSELQSHDNLVCRLLLEKKKTRKRIVGMETVVWGEVAWEQLGTRVAPPRRPLTTTPDLSALPLSFLLSFFFFLNKRAPPEFYPFPLPAPLPI